MITIHIIGDSHEPNSHWGYINLPDGNIICNHIEGKF